MNNSYYYIGPNPTVDLALINPEQEILLILRSEKSNACPGMWAFPGGFVDSHSKRNTVWQEDLESPIQAALRELKEETSISDLDINRLKFNGIYEGNQRDPRDNEVSWSKSHAYYYLLNKDEEEVVNKIKGLSLEDKKQLDDAQDVKWFSIKEALDMPLAFDHNQILNNILSQLKNKLKP